MEKIDKRLDELHFNVLNSIFFASLGAALVGKAISTRIRGTKSQMDSLAQALLSSRAFQDELNRPGATVDSVIDKLNIKNMSAAQFERAFGVPWPL